MNHIGTVNIETKRLLLRRFVIEDALPMFKTWANDSDVTKFLTWLPHKNVETTENILNAWIESYKSPDNYNWAIIIKDSGKIAGSIAVVDKSDDDSLCEIGYCLGKNYWNRGIATEALKSMLGFLVNSVGYNRIQAYHHTNNASSGKVMVKAGMKYEGRLRQYHKNTAGQHVDCDMYAILSQDISK